MLWHIFISCINTQRTLSEWKSENISKNSLKNQMAHKKMLKHIHGLEEKSLSGD